jgi:hypothetical protein
MRLYFRRTGIFLTRTLPIAFGLFLFFIAFSGPARAALTNVSFTTTSDGSGGVIITGFSATGSGPLTIPVSINGLPVTSIGESAFADTTTVTSVIIPSSVTSIQESAFTDSSLRSVSIPSSVLTIAEFAFFGCANLSTVTLSEGLTTIGSQVFDYTNLSSITIPASVTSLSPDAFFGTPIQQINVAAGNLDYSSQNGVLFDAAGTTLLFYPTDGPAVYTVPAGVTSIGDDAFDNALKLSKVTLSSSVTTIGQASFSGCLKLVSVDLANVTTIGVSAFELDSLLSSVSIPSTVTTIGDDAFFDCTALASVIFANGLQSIGNGSFYGCAALKAISLPDSLTTLGPNAFYECTSLTSVQLSTSLTTIGGAAFQSCIKLGTVVIPNSVTTIGDEAFVDSGLTSVVVPNSVTALGTSVFEECYQLTSATLSTGLTIVPDSTFSFCTDLTSVTVPNGVTTIGPNAFGACYVLSSITLPASLTTINDEAFTGCSDLTSIVFEGNAPTVAYHAISENYVPTTVFYQHGASGFTSPTWTTNSGDSFAAVDISTLSTPVITSPLSATATYQTLFGQGEESPGYQITASSSPTSFQATGLPNGLTVNTENGAITGTPTQIGTFPVTISATNVITGTGSATVNLTVTKAPLFVIINNLTTTYNGRPQPVTVAESISEPDYAITVTYNGSTTPPSAVGTYTVVATVSDADYAGTRTATLTILPKPGVATTKSATGITATTVTLNGTINPMGSDTHYYFQFATGSGPLTSTTLEDAGNGSSAVNVSAIITIPASTTSVSYNYWLVATNGGGLSYGKTISFTPPIAPSITTPPSPLLSATGAEVSTSVNPGGLATTVYIQYGTTTSYGSTTMSVILKGGKTAVPVFLQLPGLTPNTLYYYEVVMVNAAGTFYGPPQQFTTLGFDTTLVAASGSAAPGTSTTFATFGPPAVNAIDGVAFNATLPITGSITKSTNDGIWADDSGGNLDLIAQTGAAAPGTSGVFQTLSDPVYNDTCAVAFRGTLAVASGQATNATSAGIWSSSSGSLQLVARQGSAAPGTTGTFATFTSLGLTENAGVIFFATLNTGSGITSANNAGIWEGNTTGDLALMLRLGQSVGGKTISKLTFLPIDPYVGGQTRGFNVNGDLVCNASFSDGTTGIVTVQGGVASIVVVSGDEDTAAGDTFNNYATFDTPAINDEDHVAFAGTLALNSYTGVTRATQSCVWADDSTGTLQLVAQADGNIPTLSSPALDNLDDVAFHSVYNFDPGQRQTYAGISIGDSESLGYITLQGNQAPGCPTGATFAAFTEFALPNNEQVSFLGTLNTNAAAGVTSNNNTGVWAVDNNGNLQLIARTGDVLNGKTVTALSFLPTPATVSGNSRSFSATTGDLVYLATFSDKSTAIFNVVFP